MLAPFGLGSPKPIRGHYFREYNMGIGPKKGRKITMSNYFKNLVTEQQTDKRRSMRWRKVKVRQ